MPPKKKKEYLPLFRLLGGKNKAYDIGEGEQEGYLKAGLDDEEEEEDTGWRGNLSGLCDPPVYQFPKAKGYQHPVRFSLYHFFHTRNFLQTSIVLFQKVNFIKRFKRYLKCK